MRRIISTIIYLTVLFLAGCVFVSPKTLDFGSTETTKKFTPVIIGNVEWSINYSKSWLTVEPDNGQGMATINVTVDRTGLYTGNYEARLNVFSGGEVVVFATVIMEVSDSPENGDWQIETVDNAGDQIYAISLALDSNDKAHISYIDANYDEYKLKYTTNASGEWVTDTVDSGSYSRGSSLVLDSNDNVHICYVFARGDWNDLKYASNASGEWVIETLDSLDSNNRVHIIFNHDEYLDPHTSTTRTKYANNSSGSWAIEELLPGFFSSQIGLALDSNDKINIAYVPFCPPVGSCYNSIRYVTNASGEWVTETVDIGRYSYGYSLALDSNDNVYIGYTAGGRVHVATNASGNWVAEPLEGGREASLTLDSNDKVHISYAHYDGDSGTDKLKYAQHK